ncbi:MAG: DUF935 family protein [Bacteroidales bacterium]|nr:DUF935 family protein [Bacteroidales bacterium]
MKLFGLSLTVSKDKPVSQKFGKTPPININPNPDKLEIDYFNFYQSLFRKEVEDWKSARAVFLDPLNPLSYPLQQLYADAMLDQHLQGAIEQRILKTLNKVYVLKDKQGNIDYNRSEFIQKQWFRELIRKILESKFYKYSMVFINDFEAGNIKSIIDIPRENIIPARGCILKDPMNPMGERINYKEFPNFLIYIDISETKAGKLEGLSPLTIYKRHSWASWDEFEQLFGIPIRIARTGIQTKEHKNELQDWLETMGSAAYGIFDKQTDIEIKENTKTDAFNVYDKKIERINKELSKGVLLETMTMEDGSSLAQADVHLEILQDVIDADIEEVQFWIKDNFLPIMRMLGYDIPEDYYMEITDKTVIKPTEKIKIDKELLSAGLKLKRKYLEDTYGVEFEGEGEDIYQHKEPQSLSFFQ